MRAEVKLLQLQLEGVSRRIDALAKQVEDLALRVGNLRWWWVVPVLTVVTGVYGAVWAVQQTTIQSVRAGSVYQQHQHELTEQFRQLNQRLDVLGAPRLDASAPLAAGGVAAPPSNASSRVRESSPRTTEEAP
ncbi:hypothetical protein [Roseateles amylovorans]|uniref:Uncharacterized protein n=1 Tax=Roseateles amylovorans TaxID=2978473 RepID=A0ABY6B4W7_9BURK|nr:hypothetical protein [Roseateles amylovorans]UXH80388.1 hypothetical protein N4261_11140 [Roseateles amylovorans]